MNDKYNGFHVSVAIEECWRVVARRQEPEPVVVLAEEDFLDEQYLVHERDDTVTLRCTVPAARSLCSSAATPESTDTVPWNAGCNTCMHSNVQL